MAADLNRFKKEVEAECRALGNPRRSNAAANDKKSELKFYSLMVPDMRRLAKEGFSFSDQNDVDLLRIWSHIFQESEYYEPMAIALFTGLLGKFKDAPKAFDEFVDWSKHIENWGHCDVLGENIANLARTEWRIIKPVVRKWSKSSSIWDRRLSLISTVSYVGKKSVFLPFSEVELLVSRQIDEREPYIANAVGWVLRENLKSEKNNNVTERYLKKNWSRLNARARGKFTKEQRQLFD